MILVLKDDFYLNIIHGAVRRQKQYGEYGILDTEFVIKAWIAANFAMLIIQKICMCFLDLVFLVLVSVSCIPQ